MTFVYKFIKIRLANLLLLKYTPIFIIFTIHIINKLYIRLFKNFKIRSQVFINIFIHLFIKIILYI